MAAESGQLAPPVVSYKDVDEFDLVFDIAPPQPIQFNWTGKGEDCTSPLAILSEECYPWLHILVIDTMLQFDNSWMQLDNMFLSSDPRFSHIYMQHSTPNINPYGEYKFTYTGLLSGLQVSVLSDRCIARPMLDDLKLINIISASDGETRLTDIQNIDVPWREAYALRNQRLHLAGMSGPFFISKPRAFPPLTLKDHQRTVQFTCVARGSNVRNPKVDSQMDIYLRGDLLAAIVHLQQLGFAFPIFYEISYSGRLQGAGVQGVKTLNPHQLCRFTYRGEVKQLKVSEKNSACVFKLCFKRLELISVIYLPIDVLRFALPYIQPATQILL